jgi:hypothetical protein
MDWTLIAEKLTKDQAEQVERSLSGLGLEARSERDSARRLSGRAWSVYARARPERYDLELPEALDFLEASGMTVLTADKPEDIDNWPSLDELFPALCPTCEGPSNFLGKLGNREHFRCRNCGMDWSTEIEKGGK